MAFHLTDEQLIPLWPHPAPYSRGDGTDDIPTLIADRATICWGKMLPPN